MCSVWGKFMKKALCLQQIAKSNKLNLWIIGLCWLRLSVEFLLTVKRGPMCKQFESPWCKEENTWVVWCYRKITNSVAWCSGDNVITLLLIILYIFSVITFHSSLLICPVSELETPSENAKSISPPRNLHHRWLHTLFKIWLYDVSAIQVPV